jgi:hypothetical protein
MAWIGPKRAWLVALGLFVLCAVALLPKSLVGGQALSSNDALLAQQPFVPGAPPDLERVGNPFLFDATYVFNPDLSFARREIRDFRLPSWTPYTGAGRPLIASQQSAPLHPANWVVHLSPSFWSALGYAAALVILIAAVGAFGFARQLEMRFAPALLAGVSWSFGTYFIAWLQHPHAKVYALLPWALLFVERLARGRSWLNAAGLGVAVGCMLLGGHPPSTLIVMLAVAAYGAVRLLAGCGPTVSGFVGRRRAVVGAFAAWASACLSGLSCGYRFSRRSGSPRALREVGREARRWKCSRRSPSPSNGVDPIRSWWAGVLPTSPSVFCT